MQSQYIFRLVGGAWQALPQGWVDIDTSSTLRKAINTTAFPACGWFQYDDSDASLIWLDDWHGGPTIIAQPIYILPGGIWSGTPQGAAPSLAAAKAPVAAHAPAEHLAPLKAAAPKAAPVEHLAPIVMGEASLRGWVERNKARR